MQQILNLNQGFLSANFDYVIRYLNIITVSSGASDVLHALGSKWCFSTHLSSNIDFVVITKNSLRNLRENVNSYCIISASGLLKHKYAWAMGLPILLEGSVFHCRISIEYRKRRANLVVIEIRNV